MPKALHKILRQLLDVFSVLPQRRQLQLQCGKGVRRILLTPMNRWAWGSGPESCILLFLQLFILMDLPFRLFAGTGHRRRKNAIQQVSRPL